MVLFLTKIIKFLIKINIFAPLSTPLVRKTFSSKTACISSVTHLQLPHIFFKTMFRQLYRPRSVTEVNQCGQDSRL